MRCAVREALHIAPGSQEVFGLHYCKHAATAYLDRCVLPMVLRMVQETEGVVEAHIWKLLVLRALFEARRGWSRCGCVHACINAWFV